MVNKNLDRPIKTSLSKPETMYRVVVDKVRTCGGFVAVDLLFNA